jgi:hypothetical protein
MAARDVIAAKKERDATWDATWDATRRSKDCLSGPFAMEEVVGMVHPADTRMMQWSTRSNISGLPSPKTLLECPDRMTGVAPHRSVTNKRFFLS